MSKLKSSFNIIIPLLIVLDRIPKDLTHGNCYMILSLLLKLSSCMLIS
jgi:hypothetical protein